MQLPPAVQQELARRRLSSTGRARAQGGAGERPSRAKGSGLEFADHRPYAPGDDIRALDAQVTARLGVPVVREYVVHQQLPISVVLDASTSMATGTPAKFALAQQLAAALAYAGLAGGDSVQAVTFGNEVRSSGRMQGVNRATELLGFLGRAQPAGRMTLQAALTHAAASAPRGALVVLVGDFLADSDPQAIGHAHSRAQEVLAVQVLAPDELDPTPLGRGLTRLEEPETGSSVSVFLDDATVSAYRRALDDWNAALRIQLSRHGGRLIQVRSDQAVQHLILREFLARGVIR
ncbi:DUF58 domain-containing protein [Deinococcus sp. KSM4-11]|uniref:DUF58 domain-containing protein n=1 Tax=Deinococcus sp. KSM4-11 TaxID=2568654 RepID=UPI0010A2B7D2|nr:DUF58 domain-containing protein [Deinococcus sp. KSM4-11]THF88626.1 DUF58 domain-containing protein [Deinococcus sp. KSM4-11]